MNCPHCHKRINVGKLLRSKEADSGTTRRRETQRRERWASEEACGEDAQRERSAMSAANQPYTESQLDMIQRFNAAIREGPSSFAAPTWLGHVTVLFVMKDSLYKTLGCDCYDEERDALTYTGNNPVVAHPPCQLWGKMAKINHVRWGGEHNIPGNDGGCFHFALDTVNRCGGVLEHPAETYAWAEHGLPRPGDGWTRWKHGYVCEVWQSAYGHRAQKRTWLYCSGTDRPIHPRWERPAGTHQIGFHDQRGKAANKPTLSKREANATPPAFALYLLELAATCAKWPNSVISESCKEQ